MSFSAKLSKPTIAQLIDDSGPITVKAGTVDGDKHGPPTFEGIVYSGGIVPSHTLNIPIGTATYIIDLDGMSQGRNVKLNLDHKRSQRVGHLTDYENDKKQIRVAGQLSAATEHRDQVAKSAADGYAWDASIEATMARPEKLHSGKTAVVNGRTISGPTTIFRASVLDAIGFVDRGADSENAITIAASDEGKTTTLRELREAAN
jgi:hypothetical protein